MSINAVANEIVCPSIINDTNQNTNDVFPGWTVNQENSKHKLIAFRINAGNTNNTEGVIYDNRLLSKDKSGNEIETLLWDVKGTEDLYAICGYFDTTLSLSKHLIGLSKCEVISIRSKGISRFEMISADCS